MKYEIRLLQRRKNPWLFEVTGTGGQYGYTGHFEMASRTEKLGYTTIKWYQMEEGKIYRSMQNLFYFNGIERDSYKEVLELQYRAKEYKPSQAEINRRAWEYAKAEARGSKGSKKFFGLGMRKAWESIKNGTF